jgi:hypothetical protein
VSEEAIREASPSANGAANSALFKESSSVELISWFSENLSLSTLVSIAPVEVDRTPMRLCRSRDAPANHFIALFCKEYDKTIGKTRVQCGRRANPEANQF